MMRRLPWLLLLAACAKDAPPPATDSTPAVPVPTDSLVYDSMFGGTTSMWLTPGRIGTAADGTTCREYGVRVGTKLVPLLFVREAPRIDFAGHILADLSQNCRPIATYEIDLQTAQPHKWEGR